MQQTRKEVKGFQVGSDAWLPEVLIQPGRSKQRRRRAGSLYTLA